VIAQTLLDSLDDPGVVKVPRAPDVTYVSLNCSLGYTTRA